MTVRSRNATHEDLAVGDVLHHESVHVNPGGLRDSDAGSDIIVLRRQQQQQ